MRGERECGRGYEVARSSRSRRDASKVDHLKHRLEQTGELGVAEVHVGGAVPELLDHTAQGEQRLVDLAALLGALARGTWVDHELVG